MYQINVIDGGIDTFKHIAYGQQNIGTLNYLQSQFSNVNNVVDGVGSSFMARAKTLFNNFNGSEAMKAVRRTLDKVGGIFDRDIIRPLTSLEKLQNAGSVMQRWVMANPVVRKAYMDQLCDGYSDTYLDVHPGKIGEDHYDYRRVMQGIMVDDPENDWKCEIWGDELLPGDVELDLDEQVSILSTWDAVERFMAAGKDDPVNPSGGQL